MGEKDIYFERLHDQMSIRCVSLYKLPVDRAIGELGQMTVGEDQSESWTTLFATPTVGIIISRQRGKLW